MGGFDGFMAAEREANDRRDVRLREKANADCGLCRGCGTVSGYITPGKTASYPCTCTGEASWQREGDCRCGFTGPDYFGNYDQLEHPDCPIHGEVEHPKEGS